MRGCARRRFASPGSPLCRARTVRVRKLELISKPPTSSASSPSATAAMIRCRARFASSGSLSARGACGGEGRLDDEGTRVEGRTPAAGRAAEEGPPGHCKKLKFPP